MNKTILQSINALAELDRAGIEYEPIGDHEVKCRCPVHGDNKPSLCLNVSKNVFTCQTAGCKAKGDIVSLLALFFKQERKVILADLAKRYDLEDVKVIDASTVAKFHEAIWEHGPLRNELYKRGVTDELIRKHNLGVHKNRITIPVYDRNRNVINVRRYLPGAPGPEKMQNTKGFGKLALYLPEQLEYDTVWVCGGEVKAIVAAAYLNSLGIGAVAGTAGEGKWDKSWNKLLKGKRVFICNDIDDAGRNASRIVAGLLGSFPSEIRIVSLPLDRERFPTGDINDWVAEGATVEDFSEAMEKATEFETALTRKEFDSGDTTLVRLADTTDPDNIGKPIEFDGVIAAMDYTPFLIPRKVSVSCDRNQGNCAFCPIHAMDIPPDAGGVEVELSRTSTALLEMIGIPNSKQPTAIRNAMGIPSCKSVMFAVKSFYRIYDVRITPQITMGGDSSSNTLQNGMLIDLELEMNAPFRMRGRSFPSPKDQKAVILVYSAEASEDSLTSYSVSESDLEELRIFQPREWTVAGLQRQLDRIYEDLSANVTRIYHRRDMHLACDLVWHSPVLFRLEDSLTPGWVNGIIVGDSGQGKSEISTKLLSHYRTGERVDCKNASVAGLLGGLQQIGNKWFVSWGVIPTHDRRMVILEELKGAATEVIGKLTDMRSRGIAEIPKIERRRAQARTRLLALSNPRSSRPISAFSFGIETVKELIGSLEDVRRFDFSLIVSNEDVDPFEMNRLLRDRPKVNHHFTSKLCNRLIMFLWTRTEEQVRFESDAVTEILNGANELTATFTEAIPLVDKGTIRYKIARLSAALAGRTFSVDGVNLLVRKCHVNYIVGFLRRIYSHSVSGYLDFSRAQVRATTVISPEIVCKKLLATRYPGDLIEQLAYKEEITLSDMQDWLGTDRDAAQSMLSFLVRKRCLYRSKGSIYLRNPSFIELVKGIEVKEGEENDPEF